MRTHTILVPLLYALTALPAYAGRPPTVGSLVARVVALEEKVAKLEGQIVEDDLLGTYKLVGVIIDLDGGFPARVEAGAISGTITLADNGMGMFEVMVDGFSLIQGTPWSLEPGSFLDSGAVTWTYADGTLTIPEIGLSFNVGVGGRVLSFARISEDDTIDLLMLTRLQ